ncbi:class I adenylate-forming enzyme family protein [Janibacter corallicola]|uniref:class I adenylate-forming enzyme family protein n=1 Tax=Janibacter corallicola TaxID=415212 RepID=UPI000B0A38B1|nr:AMP-binding protein [Janibacter corallicola]
MSGTRTHAGMLRATVQQFPDKDFLTATSTKGEARPVSFAELEERSRLIAAGLLERGVRHGDRVAVAAPNQVEWLELFYGVTRIGAVLVTLNVRYREAELRYMLNQSGARLVVTSAQSDGFDFVDFYAAFRSEIPDVEDVLFLGDGREDSYTSLVGDPDTAGLSRHEAEVGADDPALILYTSGTTGRPKGAVLTHRSMIAAASGQVERLGTTTDDVYLCVMPFNHVGGITCSVTAALSTGSTVVLPSAFSPAGALADIEKHRVSLFAGVPTMWSLMLAHPTFETTDTSTVRLAIIGGSNVEPTMAAEMLAAFPEARLFNLYGLSESSGASVMSAPDDSVEQVSSSIGTALTGIEAKVVGLTGHDVPAGEEGELHLRGESTTTGYWGRPEEASQTVLDGGWLRTGDMVTMDSDGHIHMRGRLKEMFIQGGYNVYPVEVENVLTAHPAVAMAAGIGVPDAVLGEVGCYYVVLRSGHEVTEEDLRDHCRGQVADYKVPQQIIVVDELPTTPSGKIAKASLRKQHDGV